MNFNLLARKDSIGERIVYRHVIGYIEEGAKPRSRTNTRSRKPEQFPSPEPPKISYPFLLSLLSYSIPYPTTVLDLYSTRISSYFPSPITSIVLKLPHPPIFASPTRRNNETTFVLLGFILASIHGDTFETFSK